MLWQPEQVCAQRHRRCAMGDQDSELHGGQLGKDCPGPRGNLRSRFTATPGDVAASRPFGELIRIPLLNLVSGQTLPMAERTFSQPRLKPDGQSGQFAERRSGLRSP